MRDIRFRGKNINTGEWVYGFFKKNAHEDCYIEDEQGLAVVVDPDTVGQMVCILDEGDEVYEGITCTIRKAGETRISAWSNGMMKTITSH